jgi:Replication-relaxation
MPRHHPTDADNTPPRRPPAQRSGPRTQPRTRHGHRPSSTGRGDGAALARRLTPRDRWLLRMLHEHGFLTTPQLVALGFASPRMTQQRLRVLHALGVTDRFQPFTAATRLPLHHILGPAGARVIAAQEHLPLARLGWRHDRALALAFSHTLPHDRATHDLICTLAITPGITLTRWWSATRCARFYGHHTRPDAYLALTATPPHPAPSHPRGARLWWEAFLEYDTGTEALGVLTAKIHGYYRLAVATGIVTPVLIFTARPGREPGARAALAHTLCELPHPALVPVVTGTAIGAPGAGPAAAPAGGPRPDVAAAAAAGRTWLPLTTHPQPNNTRAPRLTLAELATAIPPDPQIEQPHPAWRPTPRDPRRQPPIHPLDNPPRPTVNGDPVLTPGPHDLHDPGLINGPGAAPDATELVELQEPLPHPPDHPAPDFAPRRW